MRKIQVNGVEYSVISVSATQVIAAEGDHDFYVRGGTYNVLYDKPTGYVVMTNAELEKSINESTYGVLKNWS